MGRIVGIDLGTTNSVVAVLEAGRPHVIANAAALAITWGRPASSTATTELVVPRSIPTIRPISLKT